LTEFPVQPGSNGAGQDAPAVTMAFLGDISLHGRYRDLARSGADPFEAIATTLAGFDYVVGNLEAVVEGAEGENLLKTPRLGTDLETLRYVGRLKLSLVSLATNHAYDHLGDGFRRTVEFLDRRGIAHLGAAFDPKEARRAYRANLGGIRFAFLNYVCPSTHPNLPEDASVHLNFLEDDRVMADIEHVRGEADQVVLLLHWGGEVEGGLQPHPRQVRSMRRFLEGGADLVVGHHTHTLQARETIAGRCGVYSLGNFCCTDVPNGGRVREIDWRRGAESMILSVRFTRRRYTVESVFIRNQNHRILVDPSLGQTYQRRLRAFRVLRAVPALWPLYAFKLRLIDPVGFYFFGNNRRFWTQLSALRWSKVRGFLSGSPARRRGGSDE
jgi:poly-gamma-glutamate capsule biosynthesis protein CapA/YwtB (metallophosphatase superfamily)